MVTWVNMSAVYGNPIKCVHVWWACDVCTADLVGSNLLTIILLGGAAHSEVPVVRFALDMFRSKRYSLIHFVPPPRPTFPTVGLNQIHQVAIVI